MVLHSELYNTFPSRSFTYLRFYWKGHWQKTVHFTSKRITWQEKLFEQAAMLGGSFEGSWSEGTMHLHACSPSRIADL